MSKIYIARHGQDEDNAAGILNGQRDTPLTNIGLQQASVLAEKIKELDLGVSKIYSSPLQRAYKTAEIVAGTLGLNAPEKNGLLIERDFGIMTGKPVADIEDICAPEIIRTDPIIYFLSPPEAETFPELIERTKSLLVWLKENAAEENVLLVSHGDTGKMLYAVFYKLDWKEVLSQFHFGNSEVLLLSEGSRVEDRHVHKVEQYNH